MKKLVILDTHALVHRAFYALPPLKTPAGEPAGAVYGFVSILLRMLREIKPDYVIAARDLPGPTVRHDEYKAYKAHRPETPEDLEVQFGMVDEAMHAFGIPVLSASGFEADDIIGTIAAALSKRKDVEIVVVTGDIDLVQLVRLGLTVDTMQKGVSEFAFYDEAAVEKRFGFDPGRIVDYKALRGDPSDNIPGVKGIGEKTATMLVKEFGTIEDVYRALDAGDDRIPRAVGEKLRNGIDMAIASKKLATIRTDAPITFDMDHLPEPTADKEKMKAVLQRFGFSTLLRRLESNHALPNATLRKKRMNRERGLEADATGQSLFAGDTVNAGIIEIPELSETEALVDFFRESGRAMVGVIVLNHACYVVREEDAAVFRIPERMLKTKNARAFFSGQAFWAFDTKSVSRYLSRFDAEVGDVEFDVMLAAYLSDPAERDFSYSRVVSVALRRVAASPEAELKNFFIAGRIVEASIREGRLREVLTKIEIPVSKVLAAMEEVGIMVDRAWLEALSKKIGRRVKALQRSVSQKAGRAFNISSPSQLSEVLFGTLKLPTAGLKKTPKGGVISTGASELEKLEGAHPIIAEILEYRELTKLQTTYADVLPQLADPKTGRIHTTFNQTGTATGRLSSSNPNIQNIPVMTELGRDVRKAFVPGTGYLLASFDYSQIELRVAAHLSGDEKMIRAFEQGLDIHALTASEVYGVPIERVGREERRRAKTLNFGILYGMGANALAEATAMTRDQARAFLDDYFEKFSGIRRYIETTKAFAREHGYVESLFGRRRRIPEIQSANVMIAREGERMAVNMPIQATATGDIIKLAMIAVSDWIRREGAESDVILLLQVHDELVFEIRERRLRVVAPKIRVIMEQVVKLCVPLVVDVKAGPNWKDQARL